MTAPQRRIYVALLNPEPAILTVDAPDPIYASPADPIFVQNGPPGEPGARPLYGAVELVRPPTEDRDPGSQLPIYVPADQVKHWMAEWHQCVAGLYECVDQTILGPCSPRCIGGCREMWPCSCTCHGVNEDAAPGR